MRFFSLTKSFAMGEEDITDNDLGPFANVEFRFRCCECCEQIAFVKVEDF